MFELPALRANSLKPLRAYKTKDCLRGIFALVGQRIVMLHSFVKKAQKTHTQDVRIAQTRMKEIKHVDTR